MHPYTITSSKILSYALNSTDNGDYFPLLGFCQGIELLHILVANNTEALGWSKLENKRVNTTFVDDAITSRLVKALSPEVLDAMTNKEMLYHLHHRGVQMTAYERFPILKEFFRVISVNVFADGTIASTVEAKDYPIYLTQYHPEVVYEDNARDLDTDKSPLA